MKVESERLILYPLNNEEMKAMIEKENKEYVESVWGIGFRWKSELNKPKARDISYSKGEKV